MPNISTAVAQLEQERIRLVSQIKAIGNAISALKYPASNRTDGPRELSSEARARIAAAQRARWARVKGKKVVPITTVRRRKLSANALARIRAAQKARWAKWRKSNKKSS